MGEKTRAIVHRMIAKDRDKRYQSCHELIADLEASLDAMGARVAPSGLAGATARRDPTLPSAFELVGETERMPSGAPPPQPGSVFPAAPQPAPAVAVSAPAPAAVSVQPGPGSALAPAGEALPVPVPTASRSKAPLVIVAAVLAVCVFALAGGVFFALRSPLVKRFLPWGRAAAVKQVATVAPVPVAPSAGSARETGETHPPQPVPPSEEGRQAQAAAAIPAATGSAATSRDAVKPARPEAVPQRGGAPRDSRAREAAAPAAGAQAEVRRAAPALAGVAVAAFGEQLLVGTVASVVQSELERAGLQALDAAALPATERLMRDQGEPPTEELMRAMRDAGVAALVLARVTPAGQRELQYMDRYDVAYSSRVTLTCYDVATARPRGRSLTATIEYTTLTIEAATERALAPLVQEIERQAR